MPGYELISKEEKKEIESIFDNGGVLFRHGFDDRRNKTYKVLEFERNFAKKFNSKYSLAVTSGTAALRVALSVLDLKKGDEVITQSFTFVATVESIVESKATPVCTEIDETLNMCPKSLEKLINKKTKAVILVHMLGVPTDINKIIKICKKYKIPLIEDTAWGCGGKFNKKFLGTHGRMGTFSFDFAKLITTGEGGMILFQKKADYLKASAWHDHGHENNPKLPRWEDSRSSSGFNFRMTEMQGAIGIAQLRKMNDIIAKQRKNYKSILSKLKNLNGIKLRKIPINAFYTADALIFYVDNNKIAIKCRNELLKFGISTKILPEAISWHFSKKWSHIKELKNSKNNLLESELILSKAVSIPILYFMKKNFPSKVFKALKIALIDN